LSILQFASLTPPAIIDYQNSQGVIFVVDSNDVDRVNEVAETLHDVLRYEDLRDASVLILANKQDLPQAINPAALIDRLRLNQVKQPWYIQARRKGA
jgi:ADP-ribosylation factor protein 1